LRHGDLLEGPRTLGVVRECAANFERTFEQAPRGVYVACFRSRLCQPNDRNGASAAEGEVLLALLVADLAVTLGRLLDAASDVS